MRAHYRAAFSVSFVSVSFVLFTASCGSGDSSQNNMSGNSSASVGQSIAVIDTEVPIANVFQDSRLTEVSGIQRSLWLDGIYYVHNDSGDGPTIHVTDANGNEYGTVTVTGVAAIDWEGITATRRDGLPRLIVGDIGNNNRQRDNLSLVVLDEPNVSSFLPPFNIDVPGQQIQLSYADGSSYNAEALFINGDNDTVVVLTKEGQATTEQGVWQGSLSSGLTGGNIVLEYRGLVALADANVTNAITDVDIRSGGRELAVLTNGPGLTGLIHLWIAESGEGTTDALLREANRTIEVPGIGSNGQAEAISYDAQGKYLLVGSEAVSTSVLTIVPYD